MRVEAAEEELLTSV